jgi:hypothetical protein
MKPRCSFCDNEIDGRYLEFEDGTLCCEACDARLPRCTRCARPAAELREFESADGSVRLCSTCWDETDRCWSCGIPLTGEYFITERAPDRKFCKQCMTERDKCDFCSSPVASGGHTYPDGRLSCNACRATAVTELTELQGLDSEARSFLTGRFGLKLRPSTECPVFLADADEIARLQHKRFIATPGFDARERGLFTSRVEERVRAGRVEERQEELAIYVETGLPRNETYSTCVHELTHLWQFDHFPGDREPDRRFVEGLACWMQYHALLDRGARAEAEHVAANPDPIYGGGFRLVREIEEQCGADRTVGELLKRV